MAVVVKIEHMSKSFDGKNVLDDISLVVNKGENLVVFGRSGTGKSVLLKGIIGLLPPDEGLITMLDADVYNLKKKELAALRKRISFLFQGSALYDSMTVRENLEFPLKRNTKLSEKEILEKIQYTLNLVSLADAIDKMPSELSGGMKKRIGLARSIITDPEIMFYDEPTTGLDPISAKEISELILNLQNKLNMTSIIVTHDLICANIIADRVIFLKRGKIIFDGTLEKLTASDDLFLRNFFSMNKIEV